MKHGLLAEQVQNSSQYSYPDAYMASTTATLQSNREVGEGFRPTDWELMNHFLRLKNLGKDRQVLKIPEIDFYKFEPWDLPQYSSIQVSDSEWYFFSRRSKKYKYSDRANRTTEFGYWKPTGKNRKFKSAITNAVIGTKKFLVFHFGRSPNGIRTVWKMHEYSATLNLSNQRDFVLCKLMKRAEGNAATASPACGNEACTEEGPTCFEEGGPSSYMNLGFQTEIPIQEVDNFMDFAPENQVAEADVSPSPDQGDLEKLQSQQSFQYSVDKHNSALESPMSSDQDPFQFSDFLSALPEDDDVFLWAVTSVDLSSEPWRDLLV